MSLSTEPDAPGRTSPLVSVVVVNWNAADVLDASLASVRRQRLDGAVELIVVDNASSDASVAYLSGAPHGARVLLNDENRGFARANNQGAAVATGEWLLLLNPDTELLEDDCLARMLAVAVERDAGVTGPRLVNVDGSLQPSPARFPGFATSALYATGVAGLLPDRVKARIAPNHWSQSTTRSVPWVKGAAMLLRRADLSRVGGMSEATFMYGEDIDLCFRLGRAGRRTWYVADATVLHIDNHSADRRFTEVERARRVARGDVEFLATRYPPPLRTPARLVSCLAYAVKIPALLVLGRRRQARVYAAIARAMLGRPNQ